MLSPLRLVSTFWLSGAMQFISEFIWVNVNLASQTIILCFPINPHWKKTRDQNTARANQSASQDFRLATNQHLKSVDLRNCSKKQHQQNKKQTEPDLRLGLQLLAWAK